MKKPVKRTPSSFRAIAVRTMLIIAVPVLIITVFLNIYAGQNQRQLIRSSRLSSLSAYQTELEQTLELADSYLENVISANLDFQSIIYAKSKSDAFAASEMVAKTLKPLLHANGILGGFYTYSGEFDYYRAISLASYPHQDGMVIRQAVLQAAASGAPVTPCHSGTGSEPQRISAQHVPGQHSSGPFTGRIEGGRKLCTNPENGWTAGTPAEAGGRPGDSGPGENRRDALRH